MVVREPRLVLPHSPHLRFVSAFSDPQSRQRSNCVAVVKRRAGAKNKYFGYLLSNILVTALAIELSARDG